MFSETVFGIPWLLLAVAALIVAVIYVFVDTSLGTSGLRWVVLRWFHPLCWLLLAVAALSKTRLTPVPAEWSAALALLGGAAYLVFLAVWLATPKA